MRTGVRALTALAALAATTALLAGCSSTGSTDAAMGEPRVAMDGMAVEGGAPMVSEALPAAGNGAAPTIAQREIVRTGYVAMRAEDVTGTAVTIRALVAKSGGLISSEDTQRSNDATYATITAQVPADRLDTFLRDVSALGTVDSLNVSAQDVTAQAVDLDARINALQTSIDRLTELLAQAQRVEDLLTIETQLSQRQAELDALRAQRQYLSEQVALSTVTVTVSPLTAITDVDAPGFLSGLQSGWSAFVSLVMVAVTALGFLLPFAVILLIVAIPAAFALVQHARRRRRERADTPEAGSRTPT